MSRNILLSQGNLSRILTAFVEMPQFSELGKVEPSHGSICGNACISHYIMDEDNPNYSGHPSLACPFQGLWFATLQLIFIFILTLLFSFQFNMVFVPILSQASPSDPKTFPFILLGNKIDIDGGNSRVKAKEWCASKGNLLYFETSAKEDYNVDPAFLSIAKTALANERDQDIYFQGLPENATESEQRGGCAC